MAGTADTTAAAVTDSIAVAATETSAVAGSTAGSALSHVIAGAIAIETGAPAIFTSRRNPKSAPGFSPCGGGTECKGRSRGGFDVALTGWGRGETRHKLGARGISVESELRHGLPSDRRSYCGIPCAGAQLAGIGAVPIGLRAGIAWILGLPAVIRPKGQRARGPGCGERFSTKAEPSSSDF